jgi:hypothetical protein
LLSTYQSVVDGIDELIFRQLHQSLGFFGVSRPHHRRQTLSQRQKGEEAAVGQVTLPRHNIVKVLWKLERRHDAHVVVIVRDVVKPHGSAYERVGTIAAQLEKSCFLLSQLGGIICVVIWGQINCLFGMQSTKADPNPSGFTGAIKFR